MISDTTKPALPEPYAYICPKNGKVLSVADFKRGLHLEGPMRGNYEPFVLLSEVEKLLGEKQ